MPNPTLRLLLSPERAWQVLGVWEFLLIWGECRMAQGTGVWKRKHRFFSYYRTSQLFCESLILVTSLSFSCLRSLIWQTEGWAMYWNVPSCSDFPLFPYVIRGRLAVCSEVGGSVCDLGKVIFHWIVIHFALTGEAGQPH